MITLTFSSDIEDTRRRVFSQAARRWDQLIETSFSPVSVDGVRLDGIRIDAQINEIDGRAGVLGQAGPTVVRSDTGLPVKGVMQFDGADIIRI